MLKVTCAIIILENMVLVAKKGPNMRMAGKYEFPGGKLEIGESEEQCIVREIKEELGIVIQPIMKLTPSTHHYQNLSITLIPFICKYLGGEIMLLEHESIEWVKLEELQKYDWSPADIPIYKELVKLGSQVWN